MKSYKYADNLEKLATFLRNRPEFETEAPSVYGFFTYYDKDSFIAAVRACGAGKKEFADTFIHFFPAVGEGIHLRLEAPRNKVCRLVREAEYDCDPLLSQEEEASIGVR